MLRINNIATNTTHTDTNTFNSRFNTHSVLLTEKLQKKKQNNNKKS